MRTTKSQREQYRRVMSPEREGTFVFDLISDVEQLEAALKDTDRELRLELRRRETGRR